MREALAMPPRCIKQASTQYHPKTCGACAPHTGQVRSESKQDSQGFSRVCVFGLQKGSL